MVVGWAVLEEIIPPGLLDMEKLAKIQVSHLQNAANTVGSYKN